MNISTYKSTLPILFKAKVCPLVWGYHGIGKSTAPQQFADENGHKLENLRLGNLDAGDLIGLQDFSTDADGQKNATRHFMPDWLKNLMAFCKANPDKYGILHLDEINHIRRDLQSFIWQICLDRRLHTYTFPENLVVIASANPPTKDYPGTLDFKNKALLSRFCHIALRPDQAETLNYYRSRETRAHSDVADFLQERSDLARGNLESFSVDEYCKPSDRSWDIAARLVNEGAPNEVLYGMVGTIAAEAYFNFLKSRKDTTIAPLDVMEGYGKVKKAIKKLIKDGKHAELKILCEGVQNKVIEDSKQKIDLNGEIKQWEYPKEVADNVAAFAMDLPADLAMAFLLAVAGPDASALMDLLDANKELHTYSKKMIDTGAFKVAQ